MKLRKLLINKEKESNNKGYIALIFIFIFALGTIAIIALPRVGNVNRSYYFNDNIKEELIDLYNKTSIDNEFIVFLKIKDDTFYDYNIYSNNKSNYSELCSVTSNSTDCGIDIDTKNDIALFSNHNKTGVVNIDGIKVEGAETSCIMYEQELFACFEHYNK